MYSPDVSLGIGSVVYALTKVDGRLQREEMQTVKEVFVDEPHGDLALYSFFLRENVNESVEDAYTFGMRRLLDKRAELNEPLKKRFIDILIRVARAHDTVSREERELIQRFTDQIQRL
ncbi:hypothetical protein BN8_02709 [Fibrisoma limi BUZ 3]|uniref:Co-chaperone DjlA N-terminal domain-containing protein n=1 Tax=Fibrisoma limi BUZ 3 TaxID=1185876 RepID=I2GI76_9BACT|nr:TerB family tellurite resistance protein [Fibrisoma limi]CCH53601.1 hypothetical protein BN8_02709 [Fibrisoma limi BUZ 3]